MNLPVECLPHQALFALDTHRYTCLAGGFGCGKSFAVGLRSYTSGYLNQGFDGMIVSRTGEQLKRLLREVQKAWAMCGLNYFDGDVKRFLRDAPDVSYTKYGDRQLIVKWGGNQISNIYLGTTENYAYEKWAGGNLAWVIIDEIDTMPRAEEVFSFANDRVRVGPFNQTACASTPEGFGFCWSFFEQAPIKDPTLTNRSLIRGNTLDSPYINKDYVLNQIHTRDPASMRAYVYGEFCNLDGSLVYWNFDKDLNKTNKTMASFGPNAIAHVSIDWNKNINACNISFVKDGYTYAVYEINGSADAAELIRRLRLVLKGKPAMFYPDGSGYEAIRQFEREFGAAAVHYHAANPLIPLRVAALNQRFRSPTKMPLTFINAETCPNLYMGIMRQTKDEKGMPDKKKGLDHNCFVGDTPVHTPQGAVSIKDLVGTSGLVRSINGFEAYTNVRLTQSSAKVVRLVFRLGAHVTCTPDHRFLTTVGWVPALDLAGRIVINRGTTGDPLCTSPSLAQLSKPLMAPNTTSAALTTKTPADDFIVQSGSTITAQSHKGTIYTIWMKTLRTMRQAIYSACQQVFTCHTITRASHEHFLVPVLSPLLSGTLQPKVPLGTHKCLSSRGLNVKNTPTPASSAAVSSAPTVSAEECAGSRVEIGTTLVCLEVQPVEEEHPVYCLEVPSTRAFAVGPGVIAHNCDGFGYFHYWNWPVDDGIGTASTLQRENEPKYTLTDVWNR